VNEIEMRSHEQGDCWTSSVKVRSSEKLSSAGVGIGVGLRELVELSLA
jgi:hypothetical protein